MILSLLIAPIEFILTGAVWAKGRALVKYFALALFFLASYQLGELFAYLFEDYSRAGVQFAYFSTTLLPPFGILLLERASGLKFGYPFFQVIGLFFAFAFVIDTDMIVSYEVDEFFITINETSGLFWYWAFPYYMGLVTLGLTIAAYFSFVGDNAEVKKFMRIYFASVGSFFFSSIVVIIINPDLTNIFASLMCAMAFGAAIVMSWASFYLDEEKMDLPPESWKNHVPFIR